MDSIANNIETRWSFGRGAKMTRGVFVVILACLCVFGVSSAGAETRSAQDMAKECRVALDVFQGHAEKNFENALFAGECIGYVQAAVDSAQVMKENISWFKVCVPDGTSTLTLIQKFIVFVDKNPKYTLASTAFHMMLGYEFPCRK
jgi:hypothetical protein